MWGEERGESLSIEFQLVRVEGMIEIEKSPLGKRHNCCRQVSTNVKK